MICRFLGGVFGCAPLAIVGGALADFWGPVERGLAICLFSGATFIGPVAGPIVGGIITKSYLGWRWTAWITLIMAALFGVLGLIFCPESYAPVLLQRRAAKIRYETKNWAIHAKADERQIDLREIFEKYLLRPFIMLAQEPILILITLYMAFIYGILLLFFEAYPISFQESRGWNAGVGALPFLSITIGVVLGGSMIVYTTNTRFKRKMEQNGGHVVPEERLYVHYLLRIPNTDSQQSSHDHRRSPPPHRPLLVRLDQQPAHHLGPPSFRRDPHRCGHIDDFLAVRTSN